MVGTATVHHPVPERAGEQSGPVPRRIEDAGAVLARLQERRHHLSLCRRDEKAVIKASMARAAAARRRLCCAHRPALFARNRYRTTKVATRGNFVLPLDVRYFRESLAG